MALIGLGGPASASQGAVVPKVRGEGTDTFGLDFYFKAKNHANASGEVGFETNSFGDFTGDVDCLDIKRRKAGISGELDNPNQGAGLTHFMIVMKDVHRKGSDPPDQIATWLRNGPFDCNTEPYGTLGDSLDDIAAGKIRVTPAAP